ncbi:MAG: chromosomal replication initiator protein DnaA [Candidatus Bipolaricaulota bacterium]|nr:chromosomal replication initiator protein DnaA [Candidatus Bipolaricaulota bacterium]MCX7843767.1 chromosomal replication initiator protein DnaA [Candidatus Bipolaricaulota bacterium]MDW8151349.1 chromosomal replication initiator protein DnaA [Candidatus Bipolaricaulota bacterium]
MGQPWEEIWARVRADLAEEIPPTSFAAWFSAVRARADGEELVLEVPSSFAKLAIEQKYQELLSRLLAEAVGRPVAWRIEVAPHLAPAHPPEPPFARRYVGSLPLNPEYTFETFVRGKNSDLAYAAAQAVAVSPARAYNPLFIYGKVGLGKTHLLQAIGNHVLKAHANLTVAYTTSERFTIELIQAIGANTTDQFRSRYRTVDVLLIDDVHFLRNKEGTQEELFHTFNELYGNSKQIVLSSDRPPEELQGLQDRLISRFRWGLVVDIQPPDLETRMAILREKARRRGVTVPDTILEMIASRITTNVRDLEGALIRVIAYLELGQGPLTAEVLEAILPKEERPQKLTIQAIKEEVAAYYRVPLEELDGPSRKKEVAFARQIAIYLARELTDSSFPALGKAFGGRDHTTAMHAYQKVQELLRETPLLRAEIDELRGRLLAKYSR